MAKTSKIKKTVICKEVYDNSLSAIERKAFIKQKILEIEDLGYTNVSEYVTPKMHIFEGVKDMGMPKWFEEWNNNNFEPLKTDVATLKSDMVEVKLDIAELKSLPTIAKEISELNNKKQ